MSDTKVFRQGGQKTGERGRAIQRKIDDTERTGMPRPTGVPKEKALQVAQ